MARKVRLIVGGLLILVGGVWFLQGVDVIKGSFMTGEVVWAVIGAACVIAGTWTIVGTRRRT